jgi:hypothetical protein
MVALGGGVDWRWPQEAGGSGNGPPGEVKVTQGAWSPGVLEVL